MNEWKPLVLAPRDGSFILLGGFSDAWNNPLYDEYEPPSWFIYVAFFEPTKGWSVSPKKNNMPNPGEDYKFKGHWACFATGDKLAGLDGRIAGDCITLKYWMPLPPPPEQEQVK